MLKPTSVLFLLLFLFVLGCQSERSQEHSNPPNIIYILADDLGFGDISALNDKSKIQTTNIDALATNGMAFLDAHSPSSVCSPTRYGILTGRYSWRTSLKKGVTWSWSPPLIDPARTTVAALLKEHGYHTACIGNGTSGLDGKKIVRE